jgi:DNA recombination protein RmuC
MLMGALSLDMSSLMIGIVLGVIFTALILMVIFLPRLARAQTSGTEMGNQFSSLAESVLEHSNQKFLALAQERLDQKLKEAQKDSDFDLERRQKAVQQLVEPLGKSLKDMEEKIEGLGKTGAGLEAQLKHFSEDQKHLRNTTQSLVMALKNPSARGRWGEMQLERILEQVGLRQGVHFDTQKHIEQDGVKQKPDFVIHMPNGVNIIIDVKTPMDSYWSYVDAPSDEMGDTHRAQFTSHVRGHVKQLGSKEYFRGFENTPEFVVMFLPSESLYALAIGEDQNLIEDAAKANVILASPTTIMGLLRVIHYGWQQQKVALEAKNIASLAADLYKRLSVFGEHFVGIGSALGKSVLAYNKAVGSMEASVLPLLRKFKDLDVQTAGKDIPEVKQIEDLERNVSASELQGSNDKVA